MLIDKGNMAAKHENEIYRADCPADLQPKIKVGIGDNSVRIGCYSDDAVDPPARGRGSASRTK